MKAFLSVSPDLLASLRRGPVRQRMIELGALAGLTLGFLAIAFAVPARGEEPAPLVLKTPLVVDGEVIRLGDLFAIDGEAAETALAAAPAPGERALLYPSRVQLSLREAGFFWANAEGLTRIAVTGASQTLSEDRLVEALEVPLTDALGADGVEILLAGTGGAVHLPPGPEPDLQLDALEADRRTGRFEARLAVSVGPDAPVMIEIAGRATPLVRIPVPARAVEAGTRLAPADFDWIETRADRLTALTVTNLAAVAGKEVRRPLRAGQPIRSSDVMEPLVVSKGQIVSLVFEAPGLRLTDRGRALEDAAAGEPVRVMNMTSNRVITGFTTAAGEVLVGGGAPARLASR
ncbi:MAG: flagellar basal body P-ring formation protein FlgA [Alphaproteobacteria bacterium]|nr:flagellar basal body P-ring formation protein FlgA [Alphaproteobacteria bacterium]